MASHSSNYVKKFLADAFNTEYDDVRFILVMSNFDGDEDDQFVGDIGTLDECDATGYTRQALASEATSQDNTNDRAEYTGDDIVFDSLEQDASRNYVAAVAYDHRTNDADSPYLGKIEFAEAKLATSTQVTVEWDDVAGLMNIVDA